MRTRTQGNLASRFSLLASRFSLLIALFAIVLVPDAAWGDIDDRKTEPLVIRATQAAFPLFVDAGVDAAEIEVWAYENHVWSIVPYQVDELSAFPVSYGEIPYDARQCKSLWPGGFPPGALCEFHYDLRRTEEPAGEFSTNDEVVLLAGHAGECDVPLTRWADTGLTEYRYRIMVTDEEESGCFYLYRRTTGPRPTVPDLITYDVEGDGTSHEGGCGPFTGGEPGTPTPEVCGAIIADAVDVDDDGITDAPGWRWDYLGNWTVDKWFIGGTHAGDASKDLVDLIKWRIENPPETEGFWDYRDGVGTGCSTFHGFIDGPVRVVRVIGGSASGASTTKYEFAYPGRVSLRVNLRVHDVGGPIYMYPDLMEGNVSPNADDDPQTPCPTCAVIYEHDESGTGYTELDEVDGAVEPGSGYSYRAPYQVSSDIGSFVMLYGEWRLADTTATGVEYDDQEANLWNDVGAAVEYHEEPGDKGAARSTIAGVCDTQSKEDCGADRAGYGEELDPLLSVLEHSFVMLSSGRATAATGQDVVADKARGDFSLAIRQERLDAVPLPEPVPPCTPVLTPEYGNDGGLLSFEAGIAGCTGIVGWNLYKSIGLGQYKRLASRPAGESFAIADLKLNESGTYYATAVGHDGSEGPMTQGITILHNDVVAPYAPTELVADVVGSSITLSWQLPTDRNIARVKIWASANSGGPYALAATEEDCPEDASFSATSGTHYIVISAVDAAGNESFYSEEITVEVP
jgi:hypothetical protein